MKWAKSELIRRLADIPRKGWTENQVRDAIDSLWRDPVMLRWSGFNLAGGTDAVIDFDNSTRVFGIEPVVKKFSFYQFKTRLSFHKRYEREEITIEDTEGLHLIYYALDEETKEQILHVAVNPTEEETRDIYLFETIVAWLYWPKPGNGLVYFGDERHGSEWPSQVHWWAHNAFNAIRKEGLRIADLNIGDGSMDAHARFSVTAGTFLHEDMEHTTAATVASEGLPILYRWSNAGVWPRFQNNNMWAVAPVMSGRIYYNTNSGSLLQADNDSYVLCHVFAANCRINEVFAVMGQAQYASERDAFTGAKAELEDIYTWMPHQTRLHIGTLVFHASDTYSNSINARITGEITPESLAEVVAEDVTPFLKTGWSPDVQKEVAFVASDANAWLRVAPIKPAPHFIGGDRYLLDTAINLPMPEATGMRYLTRQRSGFDVSGTPFTNYEKDRCYISAVYWNQRQGYFCYAGWRMHMWEMEPDTRGNIIKKTGLERVSGLELSINEAEGFEHTIMVSDGTIRLADIVPNIHDGGAAPFRMQMDPLEAKRHYLKTYVDIEGEEPETTEVTRHEWELEFPALLKDNVAGLGTNNEVLINQFGDEGWQPVETADGDYSAMWLIATLDYEWPLKWIIGQHASADLDEAKALNSPESLLELFAAAQMVDHYAVVARVIVKNITVEPYYELTEIKQYDDGEFDADTKDRHVIDTDFDELTNELILYRNAGLPELRQAIPAGPAGGITDVFVESHPAFPIDFLKYTKGGVDYDVTEIPKANGLIFGGLVSWLGGLSFGVSPAAYYINGLLYTTNSAEVTLAAADPDDPRIDIIVVDTAGNVSVIAGTPAANPAKPTPEPSTQIEITSILVLAGATEPGNPGDISDLMIYDENVEWTGTSAGVSINLDSTTDPFRNSKCADVGAIGTGDTITFTGASAVNKADYETLIMYLNLKAVMSKQHTLSVCCLLAGVQVSAEVLLPINGATTNAWQNISITIASLNISATTFDAIRFKWNKTGAQADHTGFYLDYIKLERGVVQPPIGGGGEKGDPGEPGADGREVELSVVDDYIVWRYVGDASWTNLVTLAAITGPSGDPGQDGAPGTPGADGAPGTPGIDGKQIELRENAGWVEWRYVADASWTQLYQIPEGGGGGGDSNFLELALDFGEPCEFVYKAATSMKFTSVTYEDGAPDLDPALDTTLAQYDELTITATTAGLVILRGEILS